jgi:hypothetical protein
VRGIGLSPITAASAGEDINGFMKAALGLRFAAFLAGFFAADFFAAGFFAADFLALFLAIRSISHRVGIGLSLLFLALRQRRRQHA